MENIYKTNDFYITSCLIASGVKLITLEKNSDRFLTFVLDISPISAQSLISDYWNRNLILPCKDVIEAINQLKTRLHGSK